MVPGKVPITIDETVNNKQKESVKITNTGNIDAYIRVAVVSNAVDEKGNVIAGTSDNTINANDKWQKLSDGYYYYKGTVAPGEKNAVELLAGKEDFAGREINILAESIQVLGGVTGDGRASIDAWKASFDGSVWTKTA